MTEVLASLNKRRSLSGGGRQRGAMSLWGKPEHKKVAKIIGYALTLGTESAWSGAAVVLAARLIVEERAALAFSALKALPEDAAMLTAETALTRSAGHPVTPLLNYMDEAAFWADMAEPEELEAYCLASYSAMPSHRQAAFLDFVGRAAA